EEEEESEAHVVAVESALNLEEPPLLLALGLALVDAVGDLLELDQRGLEGPVVGMVLRSALEQLLEEQGILADALHGLDEIVLEVVQLLGALVRLHLEPLD